MQNHIVVLRDAGDNFTFWECEAETEEEVIKNAQIEYPTHYVDDILILEKLSFDKTWRDNYPHLHEICADRAQGEYFCTDGEFSIFNEKDMTLVDAGYIDFDEMLSPWEPLEDEPRERLLESAYNTYESVKREIEYILDTVKQGIIDDTIDCKIPGDVHEWDMQEFYEKGLNPKYK